MNRSKTRTQENKNGAKTRRVVYYYTKTIRPFQSDPGTPDVKLSPGEHVLAGMGKVLGRVVCKGFGKTQLTKNFGNIFC